MDFTAKYIYAGQTLDHTPETDVAAGDVVVIGSLVGIAKLDIAAGTLGALALTGVYDVKKGADAFEAGGPVYWDETKKQAAPTGTVRLGYATEKTDAAAETVRVLKVVA